MQKNILGIDISKDSFTVARPVASRYEVSEWPNSEQGAAAFAATLDTNADHCVVEATGVYHLRLAYLLALEGHGVTVVNPLSVKRYGQMKNSTAKTDREDALLIARYGGQEGELVQFAVPTATLDALRQRRSLLAQLQQQAQRARNQQHSLLRHPRPDGFTKAFLEDSIAKADEAVRAVQEAIEELVDRDYRDQQGLLMSVPGIGEASSLAIIEAAGAFQGFEAASPKAFVKHAGLAPTVRQSGTSVRGKGSIGRSGTPSLRQKLYLPAITLATRAKADSPFKQLYLRLRARGKSFKEAIVAVMHKLLRVAVAVLKSGKPYNSEYYQLRTAK